MGMTGAVDSDATAFSFIVPQSGDQAVFKVTAPDGITLMIPKPGPAEEGDELCMAKDLDGKWTMKQIIRPAGKREEQREEQHRGNEEHELLVHELNAPAFQLPEAPLHPPEAYLTSLGAARAPALRFFKENGFMVVPNVVPLSRIQLAQDALDRAERAGNAKDAGSDPDVVACLKSTALSDVVHMLLPNAMPQISAQVARVPRVPGDVEKLKKTWFPFDMHIDGLVPKGPLQNFALLVGIPLSATPELFMGNFGVCPGSHLRLQEAFRKEGADPLYAVDWHEPLKRMSDAENHEFLPLRIELGQAYVAHYQTVHFVQPNLFGDNPRSVLYFRIWPTRDGTFLASDERKILNCWEEFPEVANA